MAIHEIVVGLIHCPTNTDHLNAIISAAGLRAKPAKKPELFYLTSRGRATDPEISVDLLAVVRDELDQAVDKGDIPSWSLVPGKNRIV